MGNKLFSCCFPGRTHEHQAFRLSPESETASSSRTHRSAGLRPNVGRHHAQTHDVQPVGQSAAAASVVRSSGCGGTKTRATDLMVEGGQFVSRYNLEEVIGKGSSSTCYRCTDKKTSEHFACKVMNKAIMDPKRKSLLVAQYCTEIQVTSGLAYMHSMRVMHRNMKLDNLMLATTGAGPEVRIIDFGLSKHMTSLNEQQCQFVGTGGYLSPEMLQRRPYTQAIDVWGLGVIVYVLLCGCLPFDDGTSVLDDDGAKKKFDLRFPSGAKDISSDAKNLLSQLLEVTPQKRITAGEALQHSWVTGLKAGANEFLESPRAFRRLRAKGLTSPHKVYL